MLLKDVNAVSKVVFKVGMTLPMRPYVSDKEKYIMEIFKSVID